MKKIFILLAASFLLTTNAFADVVTWTGNGDGYKWTNPINWAASNGPVDGRSDDVYIMSQPDQGVQLDDYSAPVHINSLFIDNGMKMYHSWGPELVSNNATVGINGVGKFSQDGSSDVVNAGLIVGKNSAASGYYKLDEGGSLWVGHEVVSQSATGTGTPGVDLIPGGSFYNAYYTNNTVVADYAGYSDDYEMWTVQDPNAKSGLIIAQEAGSTGVYTLDDEGELHVKRSLLVDGDGYAVEDSDENNIFVGGNEYVGFGGTGIFEHEEGINNVEHDLILGFKPGSEGIYNLRDNSVNELNVAGDLIVGGSGRGSFLQDGGTLNIEGNLAIARETGSSGIFNLNGGTVNIDGALYNGGSISATNGAFNINGGSIYANNFVNYGLFLAGSSTSGSSSGVSGAVMNYGKIQVTEGSISFDGPVTNSGTIESDPATLTFTDLMVTDTGVIKAAKDDAYIIQGDFLSQSTKNKEWNTSQAKLVFDGNPGGGHTFAFTGVDFGQSAAGLTDNFAWGMFDATNVDQINLQNGSEDANAQVALYVGSAVGLSVSGSSITNIWGNGYNIYYDPKSSLNDYLGSGIYALNAGGSLKPIGAAPEPISMALFGLGGAVMGLSRKLRRKS